MVCKAGGGTIHLLRKRIAGTSHICVTEHRKGVASTAEPLVGLTAAFDPFERHPFDCTAKTRLI